MRSSPASLVAILGTLCTLCWLVRPGVKHQAHSAFLASAQNAHVPVLRSTGAGLSSAGKAQEYARDSSSAGLSAASSCIAIAVLALAARAVLSSGSRLRLRRKAAASANTSLNAANGDVGVVLLASGVGKRMGANMPKQYIKLLGKEIAVRALDVFLKCKCNIKEIVVVCSEAWQHVFEDHLASCGPVSPEIKFTFGGSERQYSVQNGLEKISAEYVAVHDSARPLVTTDEVEKVVQDARKHGAALLAVPTKATVKLAESGQNEDAMVATTPDRSLLWEAHTPQVVRSDLLRRGFEHAEKHNLAVTDDVSLVESLGEPVKLTLGEYTNIKVTTPEDIAVAEGILKSRGE